MMQLLFPRLSLAYYQKLASPQHKILPVMLRSDKPLQARLFKTLLEGREEKHNTLGNREEKKKKLKSHKEKVRAGLQVS